MLLFCVTFFGKLTQSEATILDRENMGINNLTVEHIPSNTTWCSFKKNNIKKVPSNFFVGLPSLDTVYLNINVIFEIVDGAFTGVSSLMRLQLGKNNLEIIRKYMFQGLFNLRILVLVRNQIFMIEGKSFSDLRSLRGLYLFDNNLQTISSEIFHPVNHPSGLIEFEIEDNPLFCDSSLCWLLQSSWIAPTTPDLAQCHGPLELNTENM